MSTPGNSVSTEPNLGMVCQRESVALQSSVGSGTFLMTHEPNRDCHSTSFNILSLSPSFPSDLGVPCQQILTIQASLYTRPQRPIANLEICLSSSTRKVLDPLDFTQVSISLLLGSSDKILKVFILRYYLDIFLIIVITIALQPARQLQGLAHLSARHMPTVRSKLDTSALHVLDAPF